MRVSYYGELNSLLDSLQHMTVLVEVAASEAVASLLEPDLARAEAVISNDFQPDAMHEELEYCRLSPPVPRAPVAGGLRVIVSVVQAVFELARMGDLAAYVAKTVRLCFSDPAVSGSLRENFSRVSEVCVATIQFANQSLKDRDVVAALRMVEINHEMDHPRCGRFSVLLGKNQSDSVEQVIDVALLGRYFGRFADHTAVVARRVVYIIAGQLPEGEGQPDA